MNKQQQNIVIAATCGYRFIEDSAGLRGIPAGRAAVAKNEELLPDYTQDLDAMWQAEQILTDKQRGDYWSNLYDVTKQTSWPFDATASQRAEAFLKTLNLWIHTNSE